VGGIAALAAARRLDGRLFEPAITALGLALGLTLNPYMDAHASTWRFAALHVGDMGRDTAHLYDDQVIAEFHGFPPQVFGWHPEWLVLVVAVVAAVAWVAWRVRTRPSETRLDAIVLAGMSVAGIALTAQAMRTREYSVPVGFALLAVLASRRGTPGARRIVNGVAACLLAPILILHGQTTLPLLASHLPTHMYRGARPLLEANGDRPILNIAEGDYPMLRWEYDQVVCVQGLSRYFIYPYRALFRDVWEIHDRADTSPETVAILRRFWDRGVRLVAVHRTHKMMRFAEAHPELLEPVFRSSVNGAVIYKLAF
jgi:hypothetical protein